MNVWLKRLVAASIGSAAGFAYYHFIGCASGACPITSNPYISTAYGALLGVLVVAGKNTRTPTGGQTH
jgi:hypothetical protein